MTQDDIIRMAWESGLEREDDDSGEWSVYDDELLKFARKIAAAEREACAQVAKSISDKYAFGYYGNEVDTADEIEAAIRARGEKGNAS